jgi:anthranilate phosphoribosyltransferase
VIQKVGGGQNQRVEVDPAALGLDGPAGGALDLPKQAWSIQAVLSGERGAHLEPLRRQVLLNVAARLWVAGRVDRLEDGVEAGWELLASGHALTRLLAWLKPKPSQALRLDPKGVAHAV